MRIRGGPGRSGRLSLRGRLLVISLLLLVSALIGSNAWFAALLQRSLTQQLDQRLQAAAAMAASIPASAGSPGTSASAASTGTSLAFLRAAIESQVGGDIYLAYLGADGEVLQVVGPPISSPPRLPLLGAAGVRARGERPFQARAQDDQEWRAVARPRADAEKPGPAPGSASSERVPTGVVVAGSLAEVDRTVSDLGVRMLGIDSVVLVLLGIVGWFAVRGGLRPLRVVETTAAAIAEGDLTSRVPSLAPARTELGRLSAALNGMLDRIEAGDAARAAAAERMRRFIADASHELRTPLFGVKGYTELYRMGGMPERSDVDAAMNRIEREAGRLVRLVEDLLLLARLDEDDVDAVLPLRLTPMDLRTLAVDALHDVRALNPGRPVSLSGLHGGPPGEAPILGDEARLRQVTSNLVGNAVAHTPAGTPVWIAVGAANGRAVLEVRDEGPGMTAEQAERVFDRFFRLDDARGREAGGGAGLGLAIVRSLVTAHHGLVEVDATPGGGATFRVLLPLHHPQSVAGE